MLVYVKKKRRHYHKGPADHVAANHNYIPNAHILAICKFNTSKMKKNSRIRETNKQKHKHDQNPNKRPPSGPYEANPIHIPKGLLWAYFKVRFGRCLTHTKENLVCVVVCF